MPTCLPAFPSLISRLALCPARFSGSPNRHSLPKAKLFRSFLLRVSCNPRAACRQMILSKSTLKATSMSALIQFADHTSRLHNHHPCA